MPSRLTVAATLAAMAAACGTPTLTPALHAPDDVPAPERRTPALKVHLRSGDLWMLGEWETDPTGDTLRGAGVRYTARRERAESGAVTVPLDSVALLETNRHGAAYPFAMQALGVMTTVWGTVAVVCVIDPKSCFGSCPTFYVDGDGDRPVAEGFSASVARALEATDVDALPGVVARPGPWSLEMRNEALETHVVRWVRLLGAPRPPGGRVLAGVDGAFHSAARVHDPTACRAAEGDCLAAVRARDGRERVSDADSFDLAARETIEVELPAVSGPVGLVIAARQTLLTTFLFYQTLAYMGRSAGDWLARLERAGPAAAPAAFAMIADLGAIEVDVGDSEGGWRHVPRPYREVGPIATEEQVVPLGVADGRPVRVRLRLTRGNWRLDLVALAELGAPVEPLALAPVAVRRNGRSDDRATALLNDPGRHLVTYPGDRYELVFHLPPDAVGLEWFLETRGYYYEWMRAEWLAEEDPAMVARILTDPRGALRRLAPAYKERERSMDETFWASRFGGRGGVGGRP